MNNFFPLISFSASLFAIDSTGQTRPKQVLKYDAIIVKSLDKPKPKPVKKTEAKPVIKEDPFLPVPEFINQPCYHDSAKNVLIKLENTTAQLITKKKSLGLKGAKQSLTMDSRVCKMRFLSKRSMVFFIKTSGDAIDLLPISNYTGLLPARKKEK